MLKVTHQDKKIEAGCDEAGRGCLAGPVFAAAVILPPDFYHPLLNDSKQVDEPTRKELRKYIRKHALAYSVAAVDHEEIDKINNKDVPIFIAHFKPLFFEELMDEFHRSVPDRVKLLHQEDEFIFS